MNMTTFREIIVILKSLINGSTAFLFFFKRVFSSIGVCSFYEILCK